LVPTGSLQYIIQIGKNSSRQGGPAGVAGRFFEGAGNRRSRGRANREKYMALTRDEVLHVANLAQLNLAPAEIELFTRQLNDILAYMEKLQELDTAGVEPLAHVIPIFNVFREDEVRECLPRETALDNAPAREEGAFVVPRVI
jgi:aspartyl-tRNA(Asn)/glutamyl-tRNA(Gln) amidotransferase subunit C